MAGFFVVAFILWLCTCSITYAQNIKADAIEYIGARSNCIMELNATNKALLLPRIVNVSGSISSPLRGMIVYDSTANTLSYYNGSVWRQLDGINNIYNTDGTLTGDRTVTQNSKSLTFTGGNMNLNSTITSDINFVNTRDAVIRVNDINYGTAHHITIQAGSNTSGSGFSSTDRGGNVILQSGNGSGSDQAVTGTVTAGDIILKPGANKGGDLRGRVLLSPPQTGNTNVSGPFGTVAVGTNSPDNSKFFVVKYASCDGYSWTNGSDVRLKQNIVPLTYGLKEILQLNPKFYEFKKTPNTREVGFIAQEVKSIIPELVSGTEGDMDQGQILSLNYANLTAVLVKAIQEQQKEIELLKQEMAEIKKATQRKPK